MVSFPNAKINLGLHVVAKRPDGYHEIETCFYPIPWSDVLEILPAKRFEFRTTGETIPGNASDNLCVKAYDLLRKDFDLPPISIHLHKIVPMGAGLGGGSSDAASTLRLLNELFDLSLSNERLSDYASVLGSDCSFFLHDGPMLGTGRGNVLTAIEIPSLVGKFLVVVKPPVHVSTADAYAGVEPLPPQANIKNVLAEPIERWRSQLKNDFEASVFKKFPQVALIKEKLYDCGALYASMSGSGSAVFGIFSGRVDLQKDFSGMKCWAGNLA